MRQSVHVLNSVVESKAKHGGPAGVNEAYMHFLLLVIYCSELHACKCIYQSSDNGLSMHMIIMHHAIT